MGQRLTSELAQRAGVALEKIASLRLVRSNDVPAFLDACLEADVRILGIEGFRVVSGEAEPDMGAIADFSSVTDPAQSVLEAKRFFEAVDSNLAFDFTLSR